MYMLDGLQKGQNSAAALIHQCLKQNHISPHLMSLHMQPINARIEYNLTFICHSLFLGLSFVYLSELLSVYTPKRIYALLLTMCIHNQRTKVFEHRSFSFSAPTVWNSMPSQLRHTDGIHIFR